MNRQHLKRITECEHILIGMKKPRAVLRKAFVSKVAIMGALLDSRGHLSWVAD